MSALESKEYDFETIMEDTMFIIPEYQRYYSWEQSHFSDLWNDLMNLLADGEYTDHTHYMGTIICKHDRELEHENKPVQQYELVDGQQRLATLTILLNCIIERSDNLKEELSTQYIRDDQITADVNPQKVKLQEGNLNDNKVFRQILDGEEDVEPDAPSQERLIAARDFFRQKISEELEEREQETFLNHLIDQITSLKFMAYNIETDEKATLIFESINDRGKGLTKLEKTKSFLMHRTYLCTIEPEKRTERINEIRSNFATIYACLEKINNTDIIGRVDEDAIQSHHFVSYASDNLIEEYTDGSPNREEAKEQYLSIIKQYFESIGGEKSNEEWEKVREYSSDLAEFFETYQQLVEGDLAVGADSREQILAGDASYFIPLLVQANRSTDTPENIQNLVEVIDAAVFRIHHSNKRVDRGQNSFYTFAHDLYTEEKDIEQVITGIKKTARLQ